MATDEFLLLGAGDPSRGVESGVERDDAIGSTVLLLAVWNLPISSAIDYEIEVSSIT